LPAEGLRAVQVSSTHLPTVSHNDLWQVLLFAAAVGLLVWGIAPMVRDRRWRAGAATARGQVVDLVTWGPGRRRATWLPIIEFQVDGGSVRFHSRTARTGEAWPVGHPVDVLYDRQDPRRAGLADAGPTLSWTLISGIAAFGLFLAVVAG
jgi:hypothetical protein